MKGVFITFEGPDGSGKSTQISLLTSYLKNKGYRVINTREPGGTDISEKIRDIILDTENSKMYSMTEALLYAASRAQHVAELIKPALEDGCIAISDRFMDSSIVYQGYARALGDCVRVINEYAVMGVQPDLTFFMDIKAEDGIARAEKREKLDRLEQENIDFHRAVYNGYKELEKIYSERFITIDASESIESISEKIISYFEEHIARA